MHKCAPNSQWGLQARSWGHEPQRREPALQTAAPTTPVGEKSPIYPLKQTLAALELQKFWKRKWEDCVCLVSLIDWKYIHHFFSEPQLLFLWQWVCVCDTVVLAHSIDTLQTHAPTLLPLHLAPTLQSNEGDNLGNQERAISSFSLCIHCSESEMVRQAEWRAYTLTSVQNAGFSVTRPVPLILHPGNHAQSTHEETAESGTHLGSSMSCRNL